MTLKELIETLETQPPSKTVAVGFNRPHSYRGYYEDLAFHPAENISVKEMLDAARGAMGKNYCGYKGGEFEMNEHTTVWLAEYGNCGEPIGPILLSLMMKNEVSK